jgi:hypothetical protein
VGSLPTGKVDDFTDAATAAAARACGLRTEQRLRPLQQARPRHENPLHLRA